MDSIYDELPKWFTDRYKVELTPTEESGKYWVRMEDCIRLFEEKK